MPMVAKLLRKKPLYTTDHQTLNRHLSTLDLIFMGIGAIIGAGVFVLTGIAAATKAGPAVVLSYLFAGIAAAFAALAYAELAAAIGGTGSAYGYAYTGFGEIIAWLIGWNLLLEYATSVATVAIGWSQYVMNLLTSININLPYAVTHNPFEGGKVNLLAMAIILLTAYLLALGVKQSARFNAAIVTIKLITIAMFIVVASHHFNSAYWQPFFPFGLNGVMHGAALVFFAYIGFDALSTAVEEAKYPERSVPVGILVALGVCTLIYIAVAGLLTGIVPYQILNVGSPVSAALLHVGEHMVAGMIAAGAIAGLTTVTLVMYYGLTRIILAIARDGLLPGYFAHLHQASSTPRRIIFISAVIISLVAGFSPLNHAAELVNIGTLAAFAFVCGGTAIMRITHPEMPRPFRMPCSPYLPIAGVICCIYLMLQLPPITWWRFLIWTIFGLLIYFFYGIQKSKLAK